MKVTRYRLAKKKKCPATNKRRFAEAVDVLIDHADNPRPIRAYKCEFCGDYHATSRPRRK